MRTVGLVFGCFIPMHTGHCSLIDRALELYDEVILGVCGYDGDRGEGFIPFRDRIELVKEKYSNNRSVTLSVVDDRKIGLSGKFDESAWRAWSCEYFSNAGVDPNDESGRFIWCTGEMRYISELRKIYPLHQFVLVDRSIDSISGTAIRNNPEQYRNKIDSIFRKYLINKGILKEEKR